MAHRLTTNYAKNYCNRTLTVKVIVENVVTCFLGHGVLLFTYAKVEYVSVRTYLSKIEYVYATYPRALTYTVLAGT